MKKLIALIVGVLVVVSALAAGIGTGGSGVGGFPASPKFTGLTVTGISTLGTVNSSGNVTLSSSLPVLALNSGAGQIARFTFSENAGLLWEFISNNDDLVLFRGPTEVLNLTFAQATGNATFASDVTATQLSLSTAASKIVPGTTSLSHRNNADSADNLLITDAGLVTVRNTVASTKACATNYVRVGPNYCRASPRSADQAWTNATACTNRTFTNTLPSDAKAVNLEFTWSASANNAVGNRFNQISFHGNAACTDLSSSPTMILREFVATAAGTGIGGFTTFATVPLTAANTFTATQANAGGNGNVNVTTYNALGYFD